jgi:hypothetical protein
MIRDKFVKEFGEEQTVLLEEAALEHNNHIHCNAGSDVFKWTLLICIGYQCFEKERFRQYHKITIPFEKLKQWIKENGELDTHDGDCDYISLLAGVYNEYMPNKEVLDGNNS